MIFHSAQGKGVAKTRRRQNTVKKTFCDWYVTVYGPLPKSEGYIYTCMKKVGSIYVCNYERSGWEWGANWGARVFLITTIRGIKCNKFLWDCRHLVSQLSHNLNFQIGWTLSPKLTKTLEIFKGPIHT